MYVQIDIVLGHINHSLFWKNLAPASSEKKGNGGLLKDGPLKQAIDKDLGGLENLKKEFNTAAAGIQGSGWAWLVSALNLTERDSEYLTTCLISPQSLNTQSKRLEISTTANQDPLLGNVVLFGVDMWEHAFYLQYQNVKPDVRFDYVSPLRL